MFQLSNNLLRVILLGRGGRYLWGDENGINGGAGFQNIGVGIVWERVLRVLLLSTMWTEGYMWRRTDQGVVWGNFGSQYMLEIVLVNLLTDLG